MNCVYEMEGSCRYGGVREDRISNSYLPLCLGHRSTTRVRTNLIAVIQQSTIKKRFEHVGPNVGYVRDLPTHGGVLMSPLSEPSDEHCKQYAFPQKTVKIGIQI